MKPSPLRLKWVNYPAASFELMEEFEGRADAAIEADVNAEVRWSGDGTEHFVYVHLTSKDGVPAPYRFSVTAVAGFEFDLEIAKAEYRPSTTVGLIPLIAVNISRIVYAGAREFLAMMTSRSTYGSAVLESVLLERRDVRVESSVSPAEILRTVFQADESEIEQLESRIREAEAKESSTATSNSPGKKKSSKKRSVPD